MATLRTRCVVLQTENLLVNDYVMMLMQQY